MKSRILIFQQIVPDYRVPVFRAMHLRFNSLLIHSYRNRKSKIKTASINIDYPHEVIRNFDFLITNQLVLPILFKKKPSIVIAGVAVTNLTFLKLLLLKKLLGFKLIAWGHGIHNQEIKNPLQGIRGRIMKFYFNYSDAILFYSGLRKEIAVNAMPSIAQKSFTAWNTLDLQTNKLLYEDLKKIGKENIKIELGLNFKAKYNLIFIGRLLPDKGIAILLKAMEIVSLKIDIALHIIGSGQMENQIKQHPLYKINIFHYGAIYDENLNGRYLFASDLFIMPGYLGLALIHAFSYALPVLTCKQEADGPFHSPEIEYLQHEFNGIICSKNPEIIADEIHKLLLQPFKMKEFQKNAEFTAYKSCTLDNMIFGFEQAIQYVSDKK